MLPPLYIPLCIRTPPGHLHLPPPEQPLKIEIEGPLVAIQRLLPHMPWRLDKPVLTFTGLAGSELLKLAYQKIYGPDICPDIPADLLAWDEYLG